MLDSFLKQSKPILFRRKEILTGSDDANRVFYLHQGYIRLYTVSREGNELTLHIFSPSSIFPILWHDDPVPDKYYLESLTPAELFSIEKAKLQQLIIQKPDLSLEILKQLSFFSRSAINKLEIKIFGNAYQQVIATILDLAGCFGQKNKDSLVINYWFTHQDIATLAGLSRERVTIELNRLLNKKLICYNSHFITIPKLELLKTEVE